MTLVSTSAKHHSHGGSSPLASRTSWRNQSPTAQLTSSIFSQRTGAPALQSCRVRCKTQLGPIRKRLHANRHLTNLPEPSTVFSHRDSFEIPSSSGEP